MGAPRTVLTSPLGLLVCLPAMGWTCVLLTRMFQHPRPWAAPLACVFLFGSPYFIENLSYSFDAPQMVLAVLLNVWAAWCMLQQTRFQLWRWFCSVGLVLAGLCLYQAAHAAFWIPVLMALVFVDRMPIKQSIHQQANSEFNTRPDRYRFWPLLIGSFVAMAMALMLYRGVVLPMVQLDAYADNFSAVSGLVDVPVTVMTNLGELLRQFGVVGQRARRIADGVCAPYGNRLGSSCLAVVVGISGSPHPCACAVDGLHRGGLAVERGGHSTPCLDWCGGGFRLSCAKRKP
jgi:hypothetical protein